VKLARLRRRENKGGMARIIDTNRHGIRREIDFQWKPKNKSKTWEEHEAKMKSDIIKRKKKKKELQK